MPGHMGGMRKCRPTAVRVFVEFLVHEVEHESLALPVGDFAIEPASRHQGIRSGRIKFENAVKPTLQLQVVEPHKGY